MDKLKIVLVGLNEEVRARIPKIDGQPHNYQFPQIPSIGEKILLLDANPALHLKVKDLSYDFDEDGYRFRTCVSVDFANGN